MIHALDGVLNWLELGLPAFLFVITVVVFFHELGHFLMARAFGIGVESFSIGFGPSLVSWSDRKGTRWKISWIPLGGYVKFLGDADAASTPDRQAIASMTPQQRASIFQMKPLYQRALVVAAGPGANFVLAIAIFAITFMLVGRQIIRPVVSVVQPASAAAAAGIEPGDVIKSVDGRSVESFSELQRIVSMSPGRRLVVTVSRSGTLLRLDATPRLEVVTDRFGNRQKMGVLGIVNKIVPSEIETVHYGFFGAVGEACSQSWDVVSGTMTYLWRMLAGQEDASQLTGPVGIAQVSGQVASISFFDLFPLAALLSISIGLVNLFPVPMLDGGHLLYYGFEAVMGRPLGARAQDMGFRVGLAVMLALMALATWNDLVRLNLF
ncbi:MAG: RIP metalloprotease RseP [Alphaproteobacteria bacterium]|nr:RIP metalloprotease RseP [Alphaproteobacteria bacterium]MBU6471953.1 RIP metalloprotease RseP [Alphaproteobacteria bacterium]MDE2012052.1 RIP metalloprotease RseP [Alphaproteobacteria bacterium]MDE2074192.1 RIP metalloprotease RseP [Alphaproteobacteria bacterium]MDE2352562.1 RIP metalloprotease RseP [Alphaproteobacteria bacterium]